MSECFHPRTITLPDGRKQVVRCNKCLSCLEHRQAEWIARLTQEFNDHPDQVYFVTLTYDDDHLPMFPVGDELLPGVSGDDITKFHADLRKRFQQGFFNDDTLRLVGWSSRDTRLDLPKGLRFKYYLTSEYGPETHRPHYHGFYSGLPEDEDLVFDLFDRVWGKGFVTCEKGKSTACAAYVAKYLVNDSLVPVDPRVPRPFARISKGLGASYLDNQDLVDWHREAPTDRLFVSQDGRRGILPRYWRDRILDDDMKALVLERAVWREDNRKAAFACLSPYKRLESVLDAEHRHAETVKQAEWHFRKNNKIK